MIRSGEDILKTRQKIALAQRSMVPLHELGICNPDFPAQMTQSQGLHSPLSLFAHLRAGNPAEEMTLGLGAANGQLFMGKWGWSLGGVGWSVRR